MEPILIIGIIIFCGIVFGEFCTRLGLPKVTGYIFAGVILNPNLTHIIPEYFVEHTAFVTNISLSFITFSVGGTLFFLKVRSLGKPIILITLFEAEFAFFIVAIVFALLGPIIVSQSQLTLSSFFIPLSLLIASLASPTDPSATLAIEHQYHAEGEVASTIMGVAVFDDILGIINYSLAVALSGVFIMHQPLGLPSIAQPLFSILGAIFLGCLFGVILNFLTKIINKETEGVLIALIISLLALCYGLSTVIRVDELLSTMTMGVIVVNYNEKRKKIFQILERYTEELIFVLFFTISAMHLDFKVLTANYLLILIFVVFRSVGKFSGTLVGSKISKSSVKIQKYTAGGLIPQGGIVLGLALAIKQKPAFDSISVIIINVIIGATIIHEILGPIISKFALEKAGEISVSKKRLQSK
jgi:Kef-type K+ transport system membrane component KefB